VRLTDNGVVVLELKLHFIQLELELILAELLLQSDVAHVVRQPILEVGVGEVDDAIDFRILRVWRLDLGQLLHLREDLVIFLLHHLEVELTLACDLLQTVHPGFHSQANFHEILDSPLVF
jgi:hypothetical protein